MTDDLDKLAALVASKVDKALVDNIRHLSIAYLHRRLQDHETDVRERFRKLEWQAKAVEALKSEVEELKTRLHAARVYVKELREEVALLKKRKS